MRKLVTLLLFGAVASLAIGCASNLTARKRIDTRLPAGSRVAVLPFENLSGAENAAERITSNFQTALAGSDRVKVIPYGEVYDGLRRFRVRSATLLTKDQIDSLASVLNVQYLLAGSVLEYEERDDRFLGTVPIVSFNCRLIECSDGATVWVGTSSGRGDKGEFLFGIGAIRSTDNLSRKMVDKAAATIAGMFDR